MIFAFGIPSNTYNIQTSIAHQNIPSICVLFIPIFTCEYVRICLFSCSVGCVHTYVSKLPKTASTFTMLVYIYRVYKKHRQFWNGSQPREAAWSMKFFINIHCLGTYGVEYINENILKFKCFNAGVCVFWSTLKMACARNLKA